MTDILFSHLLIIFLCLPVLLRPFAGTLAQYQSRRDTFSIIPLIALGVCILSIIAFSLELSNLILLLFCLIVFLLNLNRFISFCTQMQRDYFTVFFKIFSLLLFVILLLITVLLLVFRPSPLPAIKAEQQKTLYYGSSSRGFFTRKTFFDPITAIKTEYMPESSLLTPENKLPTVLYIPDLFTNTSDALEQLLLLSEQGYRVISFDFYPSDITYINPLWDTAVFRSFAQRVLLINNPSFFDENLTRFQDNKEREIFAALSILQSENLTPFYIIAEGFAVEGAKRIQNRFPQSVKGIFIAKEKITPFYSEQSGMAQLNKTKPLELFTAGLGNKEIRETLYTADNTAQRVHEFLSVLEDK